MKCGVVLPTYLPEATAEGIRRAALLAESLGFDSVWTTDVVMLPRSTPFPYRSIHEALATLSWLAGFTTTATLGVSVLVLPLRHPVVVAKEVAAIDALSGGRTVLGLGAGADDTEFGYLNSDFHRRGALLDEGIHVLRTLWRAPDQPFAGKYFAFSDHAFAPPPAQPGGPPLWIGGHSPAALRRAATLGDGWHANGLSPGDFSTAAATIASLKGRRDVALSVRSRVEAASGLRTTPRGESMLVLGGPSPAIRDDVLRYRDVGCSHIVLNFWNGDLERQAEAMRRFAGDVLPALRA